MATLDVGGPNVGVRGWRSNPNKLAEGSMRAEGNKPRFDEARYQSAYEKTWRRASWEGREI